MDFSKHSQVAEIINEYIGKQQVLDICINFYAQTIPKTHIPNLSRDIAQIIINYLKPEQLKNFFAKFNIHPNTSTTHSSDFTHGAKYYPLTIPQINYFYHSTAPKSLSILNDDYTTKQHSFTIPLHKLYHCSISGTDELIVTRPGLSHTLHTIPTITSLQITMCSESDLNVIHNFSNLKRLIINSYAFSKFTLKNLQNCPNLRTFKYIDDDTQDSMLNDKDINNLSLCRNLVNLTLQCNFVQQPNHEQKIPTTLSCPKLRKLKCIDTNTKRNHHYQTHLTADFMCKKCPNLRYITFKSDFLKDATAFTLCPKLKTLDLRGSDYILDTEFLYKKYNFRIFY